MAGAIRLIFSPRITAAGHLLTRARIAPNKVRKVYDNISITSSNLPRAS